MTQEREKISEKNRCPPAFAEACVLEDGARCPFYHDGQCVKVEKEEADGQ